jgi:hypothetical protein
MSIGPTGATGPRGATGPAAARGWKTNVAYILAGTLLLGVGAAVGVVTFGGGAQAPKAPIVKMDLYRFGSAPTLAQAKALPPGIDGISDTTTWRTLQPLLTDPINWKSIDSDVSVATASGKHLYLRIHAGDGTPSDLPGQVTLPGSCFTSGAQAPPPSVTMPMPNSTAFLTDYGKFIAAFGARYNSNPAVTLVAMAGGSRQGEMYLPTCSQFVADSTKYGLTTATLTASWETIIGDWRTAFPGKTTTLGVENPLGILPGLLTWIKATYGTGMVDIQQNGLRATSNVTGTSWWKQAKALGFVIGAQTWGDVAQGSGPLLKEFQNAETLGLSYVETYQQDILPVYYSLFAEYGTP